MCHARSPKSREEEAWEAEGQENAGVGQAVTFAQTAFIVA